MTPKDLVRVPTSVTLIAVVAAATTGIPGGYGHAKGIDVAVPEKVDSSGTLTWSLATDTVPWGPRSGFRMVVFQDKLWVIGGWVVDDWEREDEVWYSSDGTNWSEAVSEAPLSSRSYLAAVVFKDKI